VPDPVAGDGERVGAARYSVVASVNFTDRQSFRAKMSGMSERHSPGPPDTITAEQKVARRIAICVVLPFAMTRLALLHLLREPRNAWRFIRMDAEIQIEIAKEKWARWWEF
jgi:hypothetical protein